MTVGGQARNPTTASVTMTAIYSVGLIAADKFKGLSYWAGFDARVRLMGHLVKAAYWNFGERCDRLLIHIEVNPIFFHVMDS